MERKSNLMDRFNEFLDYYGLSADGLAKKIGGSRGTYFNMKNGKSTPDYATMENILNNFPKISAEWFFRGEGPMLKDEILHPDEVAALISENKAIKSLYRAELLGKHKGTINHPEVMVSVRARQYRDAVKAFTRGAKVAVVSNRVEGAFSTAYGRNKYFGSSN